MLDDEHLEDAIKSAYKNKTFLSLLGHFIEKSGCFRFGIAKDERLEIYNRGFGDFGLYIRDLLLEYEPRAYIDLILEGVKENEQRKQSE